MSEPIDELLNRYAAAAYYHADEAQADARAAIEREVAALRERAERAEATVVNMEWNLREKAAREIIQAGLATGHGDTIMDLVHEVLGQAHDAQKRIADLEAERAALMEAGRTALCWGPSYSPFDVMAAQAVFRDEPGALAAWLAKEGR